jgi:acetolactate synthase-1/2/3 large subunit
MRVADYFIKTLADRNVDTVFLVTGGMAMHLNDALAGEPRLKVICHHHEQAAAYAAEGYGHIAGRPALLSVTAGPGAINSLSGVFGAFVDSVPMIVLAGQAKRELMRQTYNFGYEMRQLGEQEIDSVAMATPVTKYANRIMDPSRVRFELEKALYIATSGRPGPVWLEIPVDLQALEIEPDSLVSYKPVVPPPFDLAPMARKIVDGLAKAKRPIIVVGPGVGESGAASAFALAAERLGCPLVGSGPQDTVTTDHPQYAGTIGAMGTRAGNLALQNADLILFVGIRCYLSQITYNWPALGRHAHKIMVDEDPAEFEKPCQIADEAIPVAPKPFLVALAAAAEGFDSDSTAKWLEDCRQRVLKFPPVSESMRTVRPDGRINPYWFVEELCARLTGNDIWAVSNASSSLIPIQAGRRHKGQRFFSNIGNGAMGFGLPAAIGASCAAPGRRVICFEGDGSLMMNLQELQTLAHHRLPMIVIILENDGYVSIRQTQRGIFGRELGSGPKSGVTFPDFAKIAQAFDLPWIEVSGPDFIKPLEQALKSTGPLVVVAHLDPDQPFEPKVASRRLPDGTMVSSPPEDMSPFLPRDILRSNLEFPLEED